MENVNSRKLKEIRRSLMSILSEKALPGAINFAIGEPTYPTPNTLKKVIETFIKEDSADYGPVAGLLSFRDFLAEWYGNKGTTFVSGSENVLTTCGVTEAVYTSLVALLDNGCEVIYPDPGFVLYEQAIKMCGGVPVPLRLDHASDFNIDPQLLKRLITRKTRAVIINSPSNPTGRVIPQRILKEVAEICGKKGVTIISDEIYEHIIYEKGHHSVSEFTDNVIVCSGISKLFRMAGWRLGWCVAKEEVIKNLVKCHQYTVFRAPTISQRIAQEALIMKKEIKEMVSFYRQKRDLMLHLMGSIEGIRFVKPEATFFLYADFSKYGDDWSLSLKFLKNGVVTVPSTGPGAGFGSNGEGFIRLSYALDEESIRTGIAKIKHVLTQVS
ncbi:MAG: pyridoxal phosphate-dependent aminotransferase [Candidatus Levybacteria bacterium]|nr:pyridoxal phosphate-dependent aminotransferase [Candidatus Levybacteria bacterium]MBI2421102.1 pyridoxal phosphate-dependent aminotransferase [Candidatus Levybacteria bacterium]